MIAGQTEERDVTAEAAPGTEAADAADGTEQVALGLGEESGLTPQQQKLLATLVGNSNIQAACRIAGVARSTAHLWLKEPAFREELQRQRDTLFCDALATVKTHAAQAVKELAGLLSAPDERLRRLVCNDVLGHALKIRELEDIERRLTAVEARLEGQKRRKP
jgi:hypothetical protein